MSTRQIPFAWRPFAIKTAVIFLVWTALVTIFAGQFYWMGRGLPLEISWQQAILHAVTEWCPWLVLCPLVVWLAERFRFDRVRWLMGILPHLPAGVMVVFAYHGLSMLLTENAGAKVFHTRMTKTYSGTAPVPEIETTNGSGSAHGEAAGVILGGGGIALRFQTRNRNGEFPETSAPSFEMARVRAPFGLAVGEAGPHFLPPMPGPVTRFFPIAAGRAQSIIPIYWVIVCVTWVISYYRQLRERERRTLELEARLTKANLQSLKSQLQPHFLFNTLNAIVSLVRKKPEAAEDMIGSLSDFLRMNLDTAHQHEVPLRRELEFLNLYLDIQRIRFAERLRIQMEIDPEAMEVAVPTLILQPLVENSVRHGIEPREMGGTVVIQAFRREASLRLEIRDDGQGFKGRHLAALREGIGLSNTKARLAELYGDQHEFQIAPNANGGLTVTIDLPWREFSPGNRAEISWRFVGGEPCNADSDGCRTAASDRAPCRT